MPEEAPHGRHITRWKVDHVHDEEDPRAILTVDSHDPVTGEERTDIFRLPLQLLAAASEDLVGTISEILGNCEEIANM